MLALHVNASAELRLFSAQSFSLRSRGRKKGCRSILATDYQMQAKSPLTRKTAVGSVTITEKKQ
jgi:hypothetical protein